MKLYFILVFLLFQISSISYIAFSQPKQIQKADEYFGNFDYKKALREYVNLESEGVALYYVTHKIGDCYRHLGETQQAIDWYLKAISYPDVDFTTFYILSHELRKQERYEESEKYLKQYYSLSGNKPADTQRSYEDLILQLKEDSSNYIIHSLSINSEFSEFGPCFYEGGLVFSSNRKNIRAIKRQDIRDGSNFYKLYVSKKNELISLSEPKMFDKHLMSKYNDGPIAFSHDGTISFTTRNINSSPNKKSYLNIYVNYKTGGKWKSKSTVIPLRQINFSYMHAFMTENDERLFFVSDMEGGYGGFDIYYSFYKNGFLSPPVNLGPNINTEANELFPFIGKEGKLYFSSDKSGGLGGLDLFFAMAEGEGFSQAFNMGYPINTSSDDFALVFDAEGLSGYFTSDRPGGMGEDDIYAFQQKKEINFIRYSGVVLSKESMEPLSQVSVKIFDGQKLVSTVETNEQGQFNFYLQSNTEFYLQAKKRFYNSFTTQLNTISKPAGSGYSIEVLLNEY